MRTVTIELDVQEAKAVAAWQRARNSVEAFQQQVDQIDTTKKKADADSFLASQVAGMGRMVAGFVGVGTALQGLSTAASVIRAEYDNLVNRQRSAADTQIDMASAERAAIMNLGMAPELGDTRQEQVDELFRRIRSTSSNAGVSQIMATKAIADALSARGDKSAIDAIASVEAALKLSPDDVGAARTLSGVALDIGKITGMTPEQALGSVASIGTASRVTSMEAISKNIAPAALGVQSFGGDFAEAGAIAAAISQGLVDPSGERTKTTAISLAAQLREELPNEASTLDRIRKVQQDDALKSRVLGGLRKNDNLRTQFLDEASFEKHAIPTIEGLLRAGTPQASALDAALGQVKSGDDAAQLFRENVELMNSRSSVQVQRADLAAAGAVEQIRGGDTQAIGAVVRERLQQIAEAAGDSSLLQKVQSAEFEFETAAGTENALQFFEQDLRRSAKAKSTPVASAPAQRGHFGGVYVGPSYTPTQRDLDIAQTMTQLADTFRQILDEQKAGQKPPVNVEVRVNGVRANADVRVAEAPQRFNGLSAPAGKGLK